MAITCPFCFRTFTIQEVKFRCVQPTCPVRTVDTIYAAARGINPPPVMGSVLIPRRSRYGNVVPNSMLCEACRITSYTRICPYCHFELWQDVGYEIEQRIIAIVGGRATGKSHYIAALIHRLQNEVGSQFHIVPEMLGEDTRERWLRDFYRPLFQNKIVIQGNVQAAIDPTIKSPLMFRFLFKEGRRLRALNVSFFDTAGEDMRSLNTMAVQNRYICRANGIIFLLDPLQIPLIRSQLGTRKLGLPPEDPDASPDHIVDNLRALFNQEYNLSPQQRVNVPIAFTVSKTDMLRPFLDPTSGLLRPPPNNHPGYINFGDLQSVQTEVSSFLADWINPAFLEKVDAKFSNYGFFGISALGEQPDDKGQLSSVSPLRVEDPFLWLLYKLGLLGRSRRGW